VHATREPHEIMKKSTSATTPSFPIVGIGASAGGLAAFEAFFSGMPADIEPGMAFVLVQHLAPDHKSILADLLSRCTRMPVLEVEDGMVVRPNCVYVIPPHYDMALLQGALHLLEPVAPRGQRLPIDYFFQSLAADQREHAIGIVLSGTGSDGALGVRTIKDAGGMVMAQSTASCEYDGMPRSALATGLVDYQLAPADMAARLIAYAAHAFGKLARSGVLATPMVDNALKTIFVLLRAQTGHDFSQYKPSTIYRRIARRMSVHQIDAIEAYVNYLQHTPPEGEALFRDLLIGVTSFFRDPEAFRVLEQQVIPQLFDNLAADASIRTWTTGCSTGEEAYSLAILLVERMEALGLNIKLELFASDVDSKAIATARAGLYPASIAADVSPERLARFFTLEHDGSAYRIHKSIRDLLVFSKQDLIKDPPFSKLDLLTCRNLMIYMGPELQKRLIPLFHYALKPGGWLFLGSSEGVGEFDTLFSAIEGNAKIYQHKVDLQGQQKFLLSRVLAPLTPLTASLSRLVAQGAKSEARPPLRELTERALLRQIIPASVLINARGDILYVHGQTGNYLEPSPGEAGVNNILRMAREGLRPALSTMLRHAVTTQKVSQAANQKVIINGESLLVKLSVHPVKDDQNQVPDMPLFLVTFEESPPCVAECPQDRVGPEMPHADALARISALSQELDAKDEYLQSTIAMLETYSEDLQSATEEMQSSNEELQSVNEELATVNAELQSKVLDLSRANNDMNNLLGGTGIGTVFVDLQLRILSFTPAASSIINLIASDVGRPVAHFVSNLVGYTSLVADIKAVLATLAPVEHEVQTPEGQWYTLRIQPYRTLDNVIEGAVISFVDITERKRAQDYFQRFFEISPDMACIASSQGNFLKVNPRWHDVLGYTMEEILSHPFLDFIHPDDRDATMREVARQLDGEATMQFINRYRCKDGSYRWLEWRASPAVDKTLLFASARDITERKQTEDALQRGKAMMERTENMARIASFEWDAVANIVTWSPEMFRIFGRDPALGIPNLKGQVELYTPESTHMLFDAVGKAVSDGTPYELELMTVQPDGEQRPCSVKGFPERDGSGRVVRVAGLLQDITERRKAEQHEHIRNHTLELLAGDAPLSSVLEAIVHGVEQLRPSSLCSILLLDKEGKRLEKGIAPSLPDFFNAALEGIEIGIGVGSCGTSAFTGERVIVEDVATHPYWVPYRELTARAGLGSCWSQPIHSSSGQVLGTFAIYHREVHAPDEADLTLIEQSGRLASIAIERKQAEQALQTSLQEKTALLLEIHHRVKNNLQVITSLLRLEAGRSEHAPTKAALKDMQVRIRAMALLHETIYRRGSFAAIDLGAYVGQVATQSVRTLLAMPGSVNLRLEVGSVQVGLDQATTCGLLVSELVSNCLKHGFPTGHTGEIFIELRPLDENSQWRLRVRDTGIGLTEDFETRRKKSLGLQLVGDLAGQMGGALDVGPGPQAVFTVDFKADKPVPIVINL
jgi:two-component system CheB/CheR fusion protein